MGVMGTGPGGQVALERKRRRRVGANTRAGSQGLGWAVNTSHHPQPGREAGM